MKIVYLVPLAAALIANHSVAQERIYRCGNEYTNTVPEENAKNCKLVSGGNVTIVQSQRSTAPAKPAAASNSPSNGPRIDAGDQRAKDSDVRLILESELKKAEARQAELIKEYNNGEPEKMGPEHRNHQKYVDRIAELKAGIARNEADIAGIRREMGRVPSNSAASAK